METITKGRNWVSHGLGHASHRLTSLLGNESEKADVIAAEILEVVVKCSLIPIVLSVSELLGRLDEGSEDLSQVGVYLVEDSRALKGVIDLRSHQGLNCLSVVLLTDWLFSLGRLCALEEPLCEVIVFEAFGFDLDALGEGDAQG